MNRILRKSISIFSISLVLALAGAGIYLPKALAASGQIYLSPSSGSVQSGNNITLSVRINPGTAVDTVSVNLTYDTTKLQYKSVDTSGSAFSNQIGLSASGGTINFAMVNLGGGTVSTDSLVAKVVFGAIASSGSTNVSLSGSNAASGGTPTNPSTGSAAITITAPPATCPAGQTGTPPNCVTPSSGGSGSTGGNTSSGGKTSGGTGTKTGGSTSAGGSSQGTTSTNSLAAPKITDTAIQYSLATVHVSSAVPTTAYIKYGLDGQLITTTPVDPLGTTHAISLDPSVLIPGETYTYVVYTTNAKGITSQTASQTFQTKGLPVSFVVFDKNHEPLKDKKITLHSTPQTATTDSKGVVKFTSVSPGKHSIIYTDGKKTYAQNVTIASNVVTQGSSQSAEQQNFSIVYDFEQPASHTGLIIWVAVIILVIGLIVALERTGRLGMALQFKNRAVAPVPGATVVTSDSYRLNAPGPNHSDDPVSQSVQTGLDAIPNPGTPTPGSTVAPKPADQDKPNDTFGSRQE